MKFLFTSKSFASFKIRKNYFFSFFFSIFNRWTPPERAAKICQFPECTVLVYSCSLSAKVCCNFWIQNILLKQSPCDERMVGSFGYFPWNREMRLTGVASVLALFNFTFQNSTSISAFVSIKKTLHKDQKNWRRFSVVQQLEKLKQQYGGSPNIFQFSLCTVLVFSCSLSTMVSSNVSSKKIMKFKSKFFE